MGMLNKKHKNTSFRSTEIPQNIDCVVSLYFCLRAEVRRKAL